MGLHVPRYNVVVLCGDVVHVAIVCRRDCDCVIDDYDESLLTRVASCRQSVELQSLSLWHSQIAKLDFLQRSFVRT